MPPEEAEVLFEQEYCSNHIWPTRYKGELVSVPSGVLPGICYYGWRCPKCKQGWVTEGSVMEAHNGISAAAVQQLKARLENGADPETMIGIL